MNYTIYLATYGIEGHMFGYGRTFNWDPKTTDQNVAIDSPETLMISHAKGETTTDVITHMLTQAQAFDDINMLRVYCLECDKGFALDVVNSNEWKSPIEVVSVKDKDDRYVNKCIAMQKEAEQLYLNYMEDVAHKEEEKKEKKSQTRRKISTVVIASVAAAIIGAVCFRKRR